MTSVRLIPWAPLHHDQDKMPTLLVALPLHLNKSETQAKMKECKTMKICIFNSLQKARRRFVALVVLTPL